MIFYYPSIFNFLIQIIIRDIADPLTPPSAFAGLDFHRSFAYRDNQIQFYLENSLKSQITRNHVVNIVNVSSILREISDKRTPFLINKRCKTRHEIMLLKNLIVILN
jgi:hypothetical protein